MKIYEGIVKRLEIRGKKKRKLVRDKVPISRVLLLTVAKFIYSIPKFRNILALAAFCRYFVSRYVM